MNYKKYSKNMILIVGIFSMLLVSSSVLTIFVYDPLQLQKKDYYDQKKFSERPNMRLQAKGIITNVDFDSIIIGSSMIENTSALEASKLLGGTFVNLSMYESNPYEREIILNYLFAHKKIKQVIYSFDSFYFGLLRASSQIDGWEALYDDVIFNDVNVLFSATYLRPTIEYIISNFNKPYEPLKASIDFFDMPTSWALDKRHSARIGGLQDWVDNIDQPDLKDFFLRRLPQTLEQLKTTPKIEANSVDIDKQKEYLDTYFLSLVAAHPSTKFYVVIPPYFRFQYAQWRQVGGKDYFVHQKTIKYIVDEAAKYENLFIYGFEDQEFLDNIENYRDLSHHSTKINSLMNHAIAEGTHLLNSDNIADYLRKSEDFALRFDIQDFYDKAQKLINRR